MVRVVCSLAVLLVLVPGCSQQPSNVGDDKDSTSKQAASAQSGVSATDNAKSNVADDTASNITEPDAETQSTPESKVDASEVAEDEEMRAAIFVLLTGMGGEASVERRAASNELDELGEKGIRYVVLGLSEGSNQQKVGAATYLIGRVSPRDSAAAEALIKALSADDAALRHAALQAVEKLAKEQLRAAVQALVAYAQNPTEAETYRSRAIRAITKLEQLGRPATKSLIELAGNSESMVVRRACLFAIAKVASREVAEDFYQTQLQSAESADLRRLAAKWLAGVAGAEESLELLTNALSDSDESVRLEAVDSLVEIGKPALPWLIKALESGDVRTRRHAALAVGKLGLLANEAVPALRARLKDPDQQVRELAGAALKALD